MVLHLSDVLGMEVSSEATRDGISLLICEVGIMTMLSSRSCFRIEDVTTHLKCLALLLAHSKCPGCHCYGKWYEGKWEGEGSCC